MEPGIATGKQEHQDKNTQPTSPSSTETFEFSPRRRRSTFWSIYTSDSVTDQSSVTKTFCPCSEGNFSCPKYRYRSTNCQCTRCKFSTALPIKIVFSSEVSLSLCLNPPIRDTSPSTHKKMWKLKQSNIAIVQSGIIFRQIISCLSQPQPSET